MVLAFPFFKFENEEIRSCMVTFVDEDSSPPSIVSIKRVHLLECSNFEYKVFGDNRYYKWIYGISRNDSRGGIVIEPYNVRPVLSTSSYDFFIVEELIGSSLAELIEEKMYVMPTTREEAFRKAVALYARWARKYGERLAEPDGAFLWRARHGYLFARLVKDIGESVRDRFINAAIEYAVLRVLDAV